MDKTWGPTQITRVEIVIDGEDISVVADLFSEVGATGFTAASNVSGLGHRDYHQGRLQFNDRYSLVLLTEVLPADRAGALLNVLRYLLALRSRVLFVSDTWVQSYRVLPVTPIMCRNGALNDGFKPFALVVVIGADQLACRTYQVAFYLITFRVIVEDPAITCVVADFERQDPPAFRTHLKAGGSTVSCLGQVDELVARDWLGAPGAAHAERRAS